MRINYQHNTISIDDPNICPHCHVANDPNEKWQTLTQDTDDTPSVISAWECANNECRKIFMVLHKKKSNKNNFGFEGFLNGLPKGPDWPEPISELIDGQKINSESPQDSKFIKTYLQSLEAEMHGLDEIAGMGFRKAIEYLVKDWAIQNNPNNKEKIEGLWLGGVIKNYYEDDLKDILERATWLGNDQSHYNKLFEDYNVDDLKELIDLIMVELDRQFKMDHYINTIQRRK